MNRQIQKPNSVHAIEAVYHSVTSWNLEDLVRGANDDMSASYQLGDVEGVSVRYNDITVYFKDGQKYEEEGGYDHDIDWKEPREILMWTKEYDAILDEGPTSSSPENDITAELLAAMEDLLDLAETMCVEQEDFTLVQARKTMAKAKGE